MPFVAQCQTNRNFAGGPLRYAYIHGFASGPGSFKGTWLQSALRNLGVELLLPDVTRPDFSRLTYSDALTALADLGPGPLSLIGSSMGGYLSARWAQLHPERVDRLVLLCPGFDLVDRWPKIVGSEAMRSWRTNGSLHLPDRHGVQTPVHYGFIEDAQKHPPYPEVRCPTVIVHGTRDDVVPVGSSRRYAAAHDHVTLVEVDDDHGLAGSIERIGSVVRAHFGLSLG